MRARSFRLVVLGVAGLLAAAALPATEYAASHLVFEKKTKMKRVEAVMYMPVLAQSIRDDGLSEARKLRCSAFAAGKSGPLSTKGDFVLQLLGIEERSARWRGRELRRPVDGFGEARFEEEAIRELVEEATADGANPTTFYIEFEGGKGKRVTELTIDCVHERIEE